MWVGFASGTSCWALNLFCWQGAQPCWCRQLKATALLPCPGVPGGAAPAAAPPAAAAPGLPAALLRRGLQLYSGQQLCQVLLPHAEVYQWATPHVEGSAWPAAPPHQPVYSSAQLPAADQLVSERASRDLLQTTPSGPRAGNLGSCCPEQCGKATWLVLGSLGTAVSWRRAKHFVNSDLFVKQHY